MKVEPKRVKLARERLKQKLGVDVDSRYGYRDANLEKDKKQYWYLIVWSNNPILVPDVFFGYPVERIDQTGKNAPLLA